MRRLVPLLAAALLLAGCGPKIEAELIAGRTVMITSKESGSVTISKIVANDAAGREECVEEPGTALQEGRSYTTTFFLCDEVKKVLVETDRGTKRISFD